MDVDPEGFCIGGRDSSLKGCVSRKKGTLDVFGAVLA